MDAVPLLALCHRQKIASPDRRGTAAVGFRFEGEDLECRAPTGAIACFVWSKNCTTTL
ncbi:hypothetical protein [Microseira sp. BLCC-F43]|uniref:hypothetical protein n=1 Tax=Microseira sp. BLCC-F43 TaxID=3153602 RepID=UPI0035B869F3